MNLRLWLKQLFCNHDYKNPVFDIAFKDFTKELIRNSNFVCVKCDKKM